MTDQGHLFFRKHLEQVKFHPDVVVFFGQNFRGLISARELSQVCKKIIFFFQKTNTEIISIEANSCSCIFQVHPTLRGSIFVFSSIFAASAKVSHLIFVKVIRSGKS